MAQLSDKDELLAAWRALAASSDTQGWRTISVAHNGPYSLRAGRRFPGNEEAILLQFGSVRALRGEQLPEGHGFLVSKAELGGADTGGVWIALSRQTTGNLDLFVMMAVDIMSALGQSRGSDDDRRFQFFLARVIAWQDFMKKGADGALSPEAEVGFFGELEFLYDLISAGLSAASAIATWQGPLGGVQDFVLGTGAIEVKCTISLTGFPLTITSLDQLDDTVVRPIFLAGVRIALNPTGRTLPEQVARLRHIFSETPAAQAIFENRLLHAGFLDAAAERYNRRFARLSVRIVSVTEDFPRLTRARVPIEIRKARYDLDLDMVTIGDVGLTDALNYLGAKQEWN